MNKNVLAGLLLSLFLSAPAMALTYDLSSGVGTVDRGDIVSGAGAEYVTKEATFGFRDRVRMQVVCEKTRRGGGGGQSIIEKDFDRERPVNAKIEYEKRVTKGKAVDDGSSGNITKWWLTGYTGRFTVSTNFCNVENGASSGWVVTACTLTPTGEGGLIYTAPAALGPNTPYVLATGLALADDCTP